MELKLWLLASIRNECTFPIRPPSLKLGKLLLNYAIPRGLMEKSTVGGKSPLRVAERRVIWTLFNWLRQFFDAVRYILTITRHLRVLELGKLCLIVLTWMVKVKGMIWT